MDEARKNLCERVMIGFCFTSDWLRKWHECFQPFIARSEAHQRKHKLLATVKGKPLCTYDAQFEVHDIRHGQEVEKSAWLINFSYWLRTEPTFAQ